MHDDPTVRLFCSKCVACERSLYLNLVSSRTVFKKISLICKKIIFIKKDNRLKRLSCVLHFNQLCETK